MSVDSKQFNRRVSSYEEVERQIRRARRLRSEALARGARRWAAATKLRLTALARRYRPVGRAQAVERTAGAWRFGSMRILNIPGDFK